MARVAVQPLANADKSHHEVLECFPDSRQLGCCPECARVSRLPTGKRRWGLCYPTSCIYVLLS